VGGDGALQVLDAGLRQAQVTHLALVNQFGQRADGLLDRDGRVDPVQVIQVEVLDT